MHSNYAVQILGIYYHAADDIIERPKNSAAEYLVLCNRKATRSS
jgi:hypothetical protein